MAGDEPEALPETAKRQVTDVVPVLPFDDEPATFVLVLEELGDAHALAAAEDE
jgi:hypothetical protein